MTEESSAALGRSELRLIAYLATGLAVLHGREVNTVLLADAARWAAEMVNTAKQFEDKRSSDQIAAWILLRLRVRT